MVATCTTQGIVTRNAGPARSTAATTSRDTEKRGPKGEPRRGPKGEGALYTPTVSSAFLFQILFSPRPYLAALCAPQAVVQRLRVEAVSNVEAAEGGGYTCELTWRWADWNAGGDVR